MSAKSNASHSFSFTPSGGVPTNSLKQDLDSTEGVQPGAVGSISPEDLAGRLVDIIDSCLNIKDMIQEGYTTGSVTPLASGEFSRTLGFDTIAPNTGQALEVKLSTSTVAAAPNNHLPVITFENAANGIGLLANDDQFELVSSGLSLRLNSDSMQVSGTGLDVRLAASNSGLTKSSGLQVDPSDFADDSIPYSKLVHEPSANARIVGTTNGGPVSLLNASNARDAISFNTGVDERLGNSTLLGGLAGIYPVSSTLINPISTITKLKIHKGIIVGIEWNDGVGLQSEGDIT